MGIWWTKFVFSFIVLFHFVHFVNAQPYDYPTANLSTTWINSPSLRHSVNFTDGSMVRSILLRGTFGPRFACGFFCNGNCDSYLFAIFIVQTNSVSYITSPSIGFPQVVWSANRNNPVRINATLELTSDGDLVLKDADGSTAWSTNTSGHSVAGLNLTDSGNLVLFDDNNATVWQSLDHPTDCLVPGQKLMAGKKLTPSISVTNWTQLSLLSLSVAKEGLFASVESNPPLVYFNLSVGETNSKTSTPTYAIFLNGSLALFSSRLNESDMSLSIPRASSAQYMRFDPDGHLRVYEWTTSWTEVDDLLTGYLGECSYPTVCGNYGICSKGQCSCPPSAIDGTNYFKQVDYRQPNLGCSETTPLSCEASERHSFLEIKNTTYVISNFDLENVDLESCKVACSKNCSCRAAIFQYGTDAAIGSCFLPSQIFSLVTNDNNYYNSTIYVKVQNVTKGSDVSTAVPQRKKRSRVPVIIGSSLGSFFGLIILIAILRLLLLKRRNSDEGEEAYLDQVPGLPTRFSYEDLKDVTKNFNKVLGEGGFGCVYEGTLADGTKIAVKQIDCLGHVKKSFLTEVEAIGSVHHVNLVRLLGFCADKLHRLLVYEYMPNGSLDKWIFHKTNKVALDWQQRKKIILDIAKGLTYLHEDCRQKIIHLDIKPENILLDENFNAKISDFGLSKLIDRDQSRVVTKMRGTPGYLAPEWLTSEITEKVDIYSFGVVVLETLCERRNFDRSQPEEQMHLLKFLEKKAEEDQLLDLIDNQDEDMQCHREQIMIMLRVAAWCLQSDHTKRPSMSSVVNVLEGVMEIENNPEYKLSSLPLEKMSSEFTALLPSVLSGPR